jgi:hypothetical protein
MAHRRERDGPLPDLGRCRRRGRRAGVLVQRLRPSTVVLRAGARAVAEVDTDGAGTDLPLYELRSISVTDSPRGLALRLVGPSKQRLMPVLSTGGDNISLGTRGTVQRLNFIHYRRRLGLSPQRRLYRASQQDPEAVRRRGTEDLVHKARAGRDFVAARNGRLRLFARPYASRNPDEWVWKNVKHDEVGRSAVTRKSKFCALVYRALERLQRFPEVVRGSSETRCSPASAHENLQASKFPFVDH